MGICSVQQNKQKQPEQEQDDLPSEINKSATLERPTQQQFQTRKKLSSFIITNQNFIKEKFGKITIQYELLDPPLGVGTYGEVRKAIHKPTNILRAVKVMKKQKITVDEQEKLINEVEMLKQLDHPNIIKIFEFYQDEEFFYIVTELCSGGELFEKIIREKAFSEQNAAIIMKQLLSAVNYCHKNKIVHRDIKPENLLFEHTRDDAPLKVIDFGTSRMFDPSQTMNQKFGTVIHLLINNQFPSRTILLLKCLNKIIMKNVMFDPVVSYSISYYQDSLHLMEILIKLSWKEFQRVLILSHQNTGKPYLLKPDLQFLKCFNTTLNTEQQQRKHQTILEQKNLQLKELMFQQCKQLYKI